MQPCRAIKNLNFNYIFGALLHLPHQHCTEKIAAQAEYFVCVYFLAFDDESNITHQRVVHIRPKVFSEGSLLKRKTGTWLYQVNANQIVQPIVSIMPPKNEYAGALDSCNVAKPAF